MVYLGIDLGTTGLKSLLVDEAGNVLGSGYRDYAISIPMRGYAEQDPEDWWKALRDSLVEAMRKAKVSADDIRGIGFSGQMHGTVLTDEGGRALYAAVNWCDQRSIQEARDVVEKIGAEALGRYAQNPVAAGFQLCTLLWMKKNRPDIYTKTRCVLLPKDYLRARLTGAFGTEPSDACSTLMFDCAHGVWSEPLLRALDIDPAILPDCQHSATEVQGGLTHAAAAELGLRAGTPVVFGGGDQPMQALGNGILSPGTASITLGTGGQVFAPVDAPRYDPKLRTHTFNHAVPDTWYIMGATQNCCLAQNWFLNKILGTKDYAEAHRRAANVKPGADGLIFLPYLTGERTPHLDPEAKGSFFGLTLEHDAASMTRAVIEGISFALVDAMDCIAQLEPIIDRLVLSGGGARSPLWRQIIADMMAQPIYTTAMTEEAGTGAAICAMVGTGAYASVEEACAQIVRYDDQVIEPDPEASRVYAERLSLFRALYQANAPFFQTKV